MRRNIFQLIFSLCVLGNLTAQSIYLKMDDTCMNRLEFSTANSTNPYISYSFKLGDKQFATFDVGIESSKWVLDLPGKVTYCNGLNIDSEFVSKVNDGRIKLFIVRETTTHYHVANVEKASMVQTKDGTMDFAMDDARVSLFLNNPLSGVNLALPGSKMEVYLNGVINYQCLSAYVFHKKENKDSRAYKEYLIVPELGLVERSSVAKSGFIDELLRENVYKLDKVDGILFKTVLSAVCDRVQANYQDGVTITKPATPASYDNTTPKGNATTTTTTVTTTTSYNSVNPCAPTSQPGVHVVQKGETLYGLSKKYGVQVAQLQNWNSLANSNVISLCQRLWVKEPSSSTAPSSTSTPTVTQTTEKGSDAANAGAGYWTKSAGDHQVRSGETVASLAKMYGFTEERFRKMNGLSPNETLLPGQRLRTNDCNCPTLETSTKDTPLPYDQPTETMVSKDGTASTKPVNNQDVYYRPISVHVVKSTDTLFGIAKEYNTTVERIMELNGLGKNDKLTADQRIYVQ